MKLLLNMKPVVNLFNSQMSEYLVFECSVHLDGTRLMDCLDVVRFLMNVAERSYFPKARGVSRGC